MVNEQSNRRDFLKTCARGAGVAAVGAVAYSLVDRADADKVWQLDPNACTTCEGQVVRTSTDVDGWGACATKCVLERSAVKVVNQFNQCGYCYVCPAYYDVRSPAVDPGTDPKPEHDPHEGRICPLDAIIRRPVGEFDAWDPKNNFFEYTIDESKCNGCGRCVYNCEPPAGNASLRLEVRHNLCVDCNQCSIATACPPQAFFRSPLTSLTPGYRKTREDAERERP